MKRLQPLLFTWLTPLEAVSSNQMATYAVGDVQGCFYSLQNLLKRIDFNSKVDELWLVGDIINRGQGSLETLDWCYKNRDDIKIVLGNHDLHFLSVAFNQKKNVINRYPATNLIITKFE